CRETQDVVSNGMRNLLYARLDPLDLREYLGPIDVALLRHDADDREVRAPQNFLQRVRRLDIRMLLRSPQFGIRIEAERTDTARQHDRDTQGREDDENPVPNDPLGKRTKHASSDR